MHLNHLNLCVPDIQESRAFFETFFQFRCREVKGDDALAVLEGEDGFILVLSNLDKSVRPIYPDGFHFGFILGDREKVAETYERLKNGGVDIPRAPREMRGSFIFYCNAPGGILMEVSCPL